jgi:hypothetical protein
VGATLKVPSQPDQTWDVKTRGDFSHSSALGAPHFTSFGTKPGAPNKNRLRVWTDYYGVQFVFTLIDG